MIISALLDLLFNIFSTLTSFIDLPDFPDSVYETMRTATSYLGSGIGILGYFTHLPYLLVLFGVIVAINTGLLYYRFVMWILKKIPLLGIE